MELIDYDPLKFIKTDEDIRDLLEDAFASNNKKYLFDALSIATKYKGVAFTAKEIGCSRSYLYKVLNGKVNPSFDLVSKIIHLFGLTLIPKPIA